MPAFTITAATNTATLDAKGHGKATFTVSNVTRRSMRARAEVRTQGAAKTGWFTIEGETEREFPVEATQRYSVALAVPAGIAAGSYSFRLDVVSVANPDDDFAEGPTVNFEVAARPQKKPFPWWIPVVALVVVGLGLGLWWLFSGGGAPDVTGLELAQAQARLTENEFTLGRVIKRHTGLKQPGTVLDQQTLPDGKMVDLYVEPFLLATNGLPSDPLEKFKLAVELPDFRKQDLRKTALRIQDLALNYKVIATDSITQTEPLVVEQSPAPKTIIDPGQHIRLVHLLPAPKGPSSRDLFRGVKILRAGGTLGGFIVDRMFDGAGSCVGSENGNTIFQDGLPPGFVQSVEWITQEPVSVDAVRLFATHDTPNCAAGSGFGSGFGQRGLSSFTLLGKLKESDKYQEIVSTAIQTPNAYVNGIPGLLVERDSLSVKAQFFLAQFTQSTGMTPGVPPGTPVSAVATPWGGPRIMELDGFGVPAELK